MKKFLIFMTICCLFSCNTDLDDCCEEEIGDEIIDSNPANDPLSLGILNCSWDSGVSGSSIDYPLKTNYPAIYDLGRFMPTPRSQGEQGSCAAWATHFYLGTYLRNVATDSIIANESEIMSPAFSFNQLSSASSNCWGSTVNGNLDIMLQQGVLDIRTFPYDQTDCDRSPNESQRANIISPVISSYETIGPVNTSGVIGETEFIVKSALLDNRPVVISMKVDSAFGVARKDDVFYVNEVREDIFRGCHAMVIVGYNDDLNAFRLINSWGEYWANDGYIYVSYDFFKSSDMPEYKTGVTELTVAFTD
ncbi:cysteine protease [Nonlabens tegetincola]|uniref:C1 family peptidase n=1 Tax=Nonlabens tegetincola TaxID=323273 RepID=UPI000A20A222|nr:C1 family peptidase [Nonlabens tegetincola]ARN71650.1 cysteine protease [Nonlabens tegetincola]